MFPKAIHIFKIVWIDETATTSQTCLQNLRWKVIILALHIWKLFTLLLGKNQVFSSVCKHLD